MTIDVLVVGGGPVGLTMASELRRHGVSCRVIDRKREPDVWSKAAAVQARTMEVFRDMGLVDAVLQAGRPMYGANIYSGTTRLAHISIEIAGAAYPYILGISQRQTEELLAAHLRGLGGELERSVELVDVRQDEDGVTAVLRSERGEEEVQARYLVACDGAHSTVRRALDLPFEGSTFEQTVIQADVEVRFPFAVDPREAVMFVSDDGPCGALPLLEEGRYRLIILNVPDPPTEPPLAMFEELLRKRAPAGVELGQAAWTVSFRFHGRIAGRYRVGRMFLAGDAAHIHSPVGDQGMNMGIQDAYNLAWKVALVVRGKAWERILDSYEPERRPVAEAVVGGTDRATRGIMRMMTLRSAVAQKLRNQAVSLLVGTGFVQERMLQGLGGMTVDYSGSPLVGEHHSSIWSAEVGLDRSDERPHITDWMRFTQGPGPGSRVPELPLPEGAPAASLHALLVGTAHHLFLFDGAAATPEGYEAFDRIAERVKKRYGDLVVVHVVVPAATRPAELTFDGSVLLDADGELHHLFGCGSEALYLVRPDGYVAFRAQPADQSVLLRYLETIFVD